MACEADQLEAIEAERIYLRQREAPIARCWGSKRSLQVGVQDPESYWQIRRPLQQRCHWKGKSER